MNLDIVFKDKVSVSSKVRARHRFRAWLTIESTLWRGSTSRHIWEPSALTRYSCTSTGLHIGIIWTSRDLIIKIELRKYCRPSNFQQTLEHSFDDLNQGLYTDVTLVPEDGEGVKKKFPWLYRNFSRALRSNFQVKIHGLLLSAASPFLSNIFSTTFSPNLEHTVENNAHYWTKKHNRLAQPKPVGL